MSQQNVAEREGDVRSVITTSFVFFFFLMVCGACTTGSGSEPREATNYGLVKAFPGLTFSKPVDLQSARDGSGRLFVVEQAGRILVFENSETASRAEVFLDIRAIVNDAGREEGLLGLAFDPAFVQNRNYFVYYSVSNPRRTRVSRFTADVQRPDTTAVGSQQDVIDIAQPHANHNGGQVAFGPDGLLYIGPGDGGSGDDPDNHGQNRTTLLGNILRIDARSLPYSIPQDNPYAGNQDGYREEIYAYGMRNPWRFSFDPVTGWLWCGDVGQNTWEEIDIIKRGRNYGWKIMEASHCRPPTSNCDTSGLEPPVWEYDHSGSRGSVTGGYVYRGSRLTELVGAYIHADFVSGEIWALRYRESSEPTNALLVDSGLDVSSFGVDDRGELYICAFDGKIYKLTPE